MKDQINLALAQSHSLFHALPVENVIWHPRTTEILANNAKVVRKDKFYNNCSASNTCSCYFFRCWKEKS